MESLLGNIDIILGVSILLLSIFHKFAVPSVLGFLVTGMLLGPYGLGLIGETQGVEILAEFGVIFLLFIIGVELSLKELWEIKKTVLAGGTLQVLLTILLVFLLCTQLGFSRATSVFIGFLISLSSTAIVLKILQEKSEVYSPHGRTSLAVLIFQDIIIVPMILVTPLLAGGSEGVTGLLLILLFKGVGIILLVILSARYIVPRLLYYVATTRSRELFLLSVIFICLSTALLTSSAGLSLALGAFLAGLVISESEYSQQTAGYITPFKDVFMSFFFVSIGMLLDVQYFLQNPHVFILMAFAVVFLKAFSGAIATFLLGYPLRTTLLTGLALSQVGEFSFVLSKFGLEFNLLNQNTYQTFLAVSILTMGITPFVINGSPGVVDFFLRKVSDTKLVHGLYSNRLRSDKRCFGKLHPDKPHSDKSHPGPGKIEVGEELKLNDHLIIVGYGFNGRTVSKAAKTAGIPYIIIEINPEIVRREKARGERIYYGDATYEAVMEHAGIRDARILVIGISDPAATRKAVKMVKHLNPKIHIIARTRYLREMEPLHALGAEEIIPEEYETSVEVFVRLLEKYLVPGEDIEKLVREIRADGYGMLRKLSDGKPVKFNIRKDLPGLEVTVIRVHEGSEIAGKTLTDMELRKKHGVTVLSIRRDSDMIHTPDGCTPIQANDVCILLGKPRKLHDARRFFE
ncbi:Glutathione-regulated potassium-efflux system protein KefC [Methanosarcina sp. MTP4]|uniref:cation:proton antiporter domain-containing protein n=1 Tax=Methanosarcina sp. MTP4 TaxID=1434100 RepID=UPI000615A6A1|nr:cation:proton antiporter [Methanosarcina sp. MTP4]AKB24719.1 Glutathione-regulated potassium-efflux system protein KefC [Methanosarcina sp. MTP4]